MPQPLTLNPAVLCREEGNLCLGGKTVPIYEYVCNSCRHQFEVKQSVNDPPLSVCDRCGHSVTKLISAPAIMFKGTGWYVTDYSNKLKEPAQTQSSSANGAEQSKTDTKPSSSPASSEGAASTSSPPPTSSTATADSSSKPSKTEPSKPSS
jgi:putative FmdB family regulatory protein